MAATKPDFSELEAMRKDDCSWRPCCISLSVCSSSDGPNVGIIVDFGNGDEDLLYNKEDALSRVRFRSTPLQGDECTNIKEGDRVLALQKAQSKSLFIDATIEQAKRVKHSKRVHCRCTFEVKWLNSGLKGEIVTVPSMSIHRFSDRSIDEHPIFSSFVKALSSKNGGGSPSILSFTEESSCEAEFVGILEKQVEEISKLVDGPITSFTNLFIDAKSADIIKQKPSTAFVQSKSPKIRQSSSKRTTRSQRNNQIETEVREETELKPVLSPLAARAALASLVHELPEKSCYFSGGEEFLKLKDSQQSDSTGVTELSALEAISNSVKSTCNHQIKVLLATNSSKIKKDYTSIEVTNPPIASSNRRISEENISTHGTLNLSANQEKEMEASRDYKANIPQNSSLENREKTKIPTSTRMTRSQQIKPEVTFLGAEPANSRNSVFDKGSFSKSPSFLVEELSSNDDDDDIEGSLTKKSRGLTIGTGRRIPTRQRKKCSSNIDMSAETGNKADEIGSHEVKGKKFISTHVDSTSETDSTAQRNELATKKKKRVSCEYNMGSDPKNEENHQTAKKNHVSSKKALKTTPSRSSPRLACPLRTRSQSSI
ncbi:hypothetical protein KSP39_PZI008928 [Platanthera zijinensis]|uniref:SAWADEE domain-containing protein n=1 Tax=Platanthera zijinensis TaxID=2320716 RepID=A0AAP0BK84_9ASPA